MTIVGTSHFTSLAAARGYYRLLGVGAELVRQKIERGEIHIGKPEVKPGERLFTIDGGARYAVESALRPATNGLFPARQRVVDTLAIGLVTLLEAGGDKDKPNLDEARRMAWELLGEAGWE